MFVKRCASKRNGNTHETFHVVESYRQDDGTPSHRYLMNLTPLPKPLISHIKKLLQHEEDLEDLDDLDDVLTSGSSVDVELGD